MTREVYSQESATAIMNVYVKNIETKISCDSTFFLTNQFDESIIFQSINCISNGVDSQSVHLKVMLAESEANLRVQYHDKFNSSISYF